jgi:nucleoside-diphosphate-sugar epimerase
MDIRRTNLASGSERVLITGGTGFTGCALAERLRQDGHDVIAIGLEANNDTALNVDLRDFDGVTRAISHIRPTAVVHLAGIALLTHGNVGEIYSANVVGTANLLAALSTAKIEPKIVVIASSARVYAVPRGNAPIAEDYPLDPQTHYAVSKRTSEEIAGLYADRFPIVIARPFNYTGPGQSSRFLVPKIVQHYVERRSNISLGNLDLFRDYSDIGRVAEVYARLVTHATGPATINICSGRAVHLKDIPGILTDISGHTLEVVTDSSLVRADEPALIVGSPSRLESLVGPLPNPDIRETLLRMYAALHKQPRNQPRPSR